MHITWDEEAWNDYVWWQFEDRKTLKRINALIKDIQRNNLILMALLVVLIIAAFVAFPYIKAALLGGAAFLAPVAGFAPLLF